VFGPAATRPEKERLLDLLQQQLKGFEHDAKSAGQLVNQGSFERPARLDVRQLAAWMMVGNVLLNLDETPRKDEDERP